MQRPCSVLTLSMSVAAQILLSHRDQRHPFRPPLGVWLLKNNRCRGQSAGQRVPAFQSLLTVISPLGLQTSNLSPPPDPSPNLSKLSNPCLSIQPPLSLHLFQLCHFFPPLLFTFLHSPTCSFFLSKLNIVLSDSPCAEKCLP